MEHAPRPPNIGILSFLLPTALPSFVKLPARRGPDWRNQWS